MKLRQVGYRKMNSRPSLTNQTRLHGLKDNDIHIMFAFECYRFNDVHVCGLQGQGLLQTLLRVLGPSQYLPPYLGLGLSHRLNDSCRPSPQETEHGAGGNQNPQLPSTEEKVNLSLLLPTAI